MTGERTDEGFYKISGGLDMGIARGLSYAPYADLLWLETSTPSLEEAKKFDTAEEFVRSIEDTTIETREIKNSIVEEINSIVKTVWRKIFPGPFNLHLVLPKNVIRESFL